MTGILVLCSTIMAIPLTILTLPQSMQRAESVYRNVSMWLHSNYPGQIILDDNGIPVVDYGYKDGTYIGKQTNPLAVAASAIQHYDKFKESGELKHKTYLQNCINWLEDTKIDNGQCYLWAYDFPNTGYSPSAPWYSSLAQGRIMLAFDYAYQLTGEERYLKLADKAMLALATPIKEGGVMYQDSDSIGKWYAEFVSLERDKPPFILNGHMEVLQYLQEYYDRTGSEQAQTLFQDGVAELKVHLPEYDAGYWTYYDREGNLAYDYHYTHVEEVQYLYEVTGDEVFKEYHDKWASYFPLNPFWARKRFAAYLLNVTLSFSVLAVSVATYMLVKSLSNKRATKELTKN